MTYEDVLCALADPTRRRIFEDLRAAPQPVSQIADGRPVSRPAVSQHLKVLEQAGLVRAEPRGAARIYSIRPQGLVPLRAYLEEYWGDVLGAFATEVQNQMESSDVATRNQDD